MDVDNRRKSTSSRNGIVAGSVWESRIKHDQVKGGFKVFSDTEETSDENDDKNCTFTSTSTSTSVSTTNNNDKKLEMGPKFNLGVGVSGKRRTWKADEVNPIQIARKRSELSKNLDEKSKDLNKKVSEFRKLKSASVNGIVKAKSKNLDGLDEGNLEENKVVVESSEKLEWPIKENEKNSKEFAKCEEKFITSNVVKNLENEGDDEEEEWDEELEEEIEKKSVDVKDNSRIQEQRPKKSVVEEKKFQQNNKRQVPSSSVKKQVPPNSGYVRIHPSSTRTKSVPVSDEVQRIPRQHNKLQSLVDLIMWRCIPKSALVFGIGTFVIISSSFTQDLNISFISVFSYFGLVYLAAIFLFRSLIHRGTIDISESSDYVVGEEEAVWVLKLILPLINEFLLKIRALFSGDPATTMKMAVLLFVLARFGSYITIWKLSKLGFFGVFIIPKICCSYSTPLTSYGTFCIRYLRDTWESCTHKKAIGFAIFTVVWNFSSIIARIWAVFMLYVSFRYYQRTLMRERCVGEETTIKADDSLHGKIIGQRQVGRKSSLMETRKQKKAF